jgi:hypothetical protein
VYFLNYLRFFICFFAIVKVFGTDNELTVDNLRVENKCEHLRFSIFGGSKIDRTKFLELFQENLDSHEHKLRFFNAPDNTFLKILIDLKRSYIDLKQSCQEVLSVNDSDTIDQMLDPTRSKFDIRDNTPEELQQLKLSYLHKQRGNKLFILFSGYFGLKESETLDFGDLINDAFSIDSGINELEIYAPFHWDHSFGGHAEFMKMSCHKARGVVTASINTFDSEISTIERRMRRSKTDSSLMRAIQEQFARKNVELQNMQRTFLGLQSINSMDCNVFTAAFLYLKWKTGLDPQEIKNQQRLYENMQMLVDRSAVYNGQKERSFLSQATQFYEHLNKQLGIWHRAELDQRLSNPVIRSMKLYAYESMGWCLGFTVGWCLGVVTDTVDLSTRLFCRN